MMPSARLFRTAFTALLFCGAAWTAEALQLGETKTQLLARHGAPGAEDRARNLAIYSWDGWSAHAEFANEAVQKLTYRRNWYLGDKEVSALLQSNGGVARWSEVTGGEGKTRQWRRDDGALASCQVERALSMTFQIAGLTTPAAPAPAAAPKVVVPATPPVVSSTPPRFPKLLGSTSDTEFAKSEDTAPEVVLTSVARPLPKLPAEEIQPTTLSTEATSTLELKPIVAKQEPETKVLTRPEGNPPGEEAKSTRAPRADEPGTGGIIFGALVFCGFLAGAAFFVWKWRSGRSAPKRATFAPPSARPAARASASGFGSLRGDQFELLVGEIFRRQGCTVELSAALGQEDSIDLTLRRDSETILVQCKHWQTPRVTEREMREFYGAMAATGAPRGIVVTTGTFTRDALDFAEGKGIDPIDGATLQASMAEVARPGENLAELPGWIGEFAAHAHVFDPECPACQGSMVIRSNPTTGAQVWACRGYPRCPGKREPRMDLLNVAAAH